MFDLSWDRVHQVTQIFHSSAHVQSVWSIALGVTNKFQRVGESANTKSANNESRLPMNYISIKIKQQKWLAPPCMSRS